MKLNDESLRKLYQQGTARKVRRESECPGTDLLQRAAAGELSRTERKAVADHLMGCSDCAEEYHLAHSLKPWTMSALGESPPGRYPADRSHHAGKRFAWMPRREAAGLLALMVVAVGVALFVWRGAEFAGRPSVIDRGRAPAGVAIEPPNQAVLDEPPRLLAWPEVESADSYEVVLYDDESTPIWESGPVTGTTVVLPESTRRSLERGRTYYWRIFTRVGIDRRQSEIFVFKLPKD